MTEDLRSAENADLGRHLDECQRCRELYRQLKSLAELSGELKNEMEAPAFFSSRVCARVSEPARSYSWLRLAVVTTSVIAVFSFAIVRFALLAEQPVTTGTSSVAASGSVAEYQSVEPRWTSDWPGPESSVSNDGGKYPQFVEILVSGPDFPVGADPTETRDPLDGVSEGDFIVRLPSSIEVRSSQAENEYYLRNVSH